MRDEKHRSGLGVLWKMHFFSMILVALITSCGKPSKSKSTTSNGTNTSTSLADGTWVSGCAVYAAGQWTKSEIVIAGGSSTSTISIYSDATCVTGISESVFYSSFNVGGVVASPAGALELKETVSKIMMTLKTTEGVTTANEGWKIGEEVVFPPACKGGFTINVPRELNPTVCAGDLLYGGFFTPSYGIVKIDGDKIYFGETDETNDGSTAAKRPTKLQSSYLTKQTSGSGGGTSGGGTSLTVLEGTWVSGCDPDDPSDPQSQYSRSTITVSGSTATNAISSFSDGTCTESSAETLYVFTSSFTIGGPVSTPSGASKIDFLTSTLDLTVKNSDLLDAYNNGADFNNDGTLDMPPTCQGGFSLNQPKRLDASECATDQISSSFFGSTFSIFKIEDGKLYLGESDDDDDDHDGSSDGNRPVIFPSTGFVKQ